MPPVTLPDTIQNAAPVFFDYQKTTDPQDGVFFRKENYTAVTMDIRHDGMPHAYSLSHQEWFTLLMVFEFVIYSFLLVRYGRVWIERVRNIWKVKEYSGLYINMAEKNVQESVPCLLLTCVNLGFFAYAAMTRDVSSIAPQNATVGLFVLLTALCLGAKSLLSEFVAYVFFPHEKAVTLRSEVFSLFSYLGVLIYSVLLFLLYPAGLQKPMLWTGAAIIALYLSLKLYKISQVFYSGIGTFFYLFLYLCTLEILPVALLYFGMVLVRG